MPKNPQKDHRTEYITEAIKNFPLHFTYHFVPSVHKVSNDFDK